MSNTTMAFPLSKKRLIDSQAPNGKCYLRLLSVLPSFSKCGVAELEDAIIEMVALLGTNPRGMDVLRSLWTAELNISEGHDSGIGLIDVPDMPTRFLEQIMESRVRFGLSEAGGVMHVPYYIMMLEDPQDLDSEIENEFGFASRFIIQQMCNKERQIGADLGDELDDMFASLLGAEDNENNVHLKQNYGSTIKQKLYSDDVVEREVQSRVEDIFQRMEVQNSKKIDKMLSKGEIGDNFKIDRDQKEIKERMVRLEEQIESLLTMRDEKTILPSDSSSNIGRYSKKFIKEGDFNHRCDKIEEDMEEQRYPFKSSELYQLGRTGTTLQAYDEVEHLNIHHPVEIAIGFKKTKTMSKIENELKKSLRPINGLAAPFKSSRLNLLIHFHTALDSTIVNKKNSTLMEFLTLSIEFKSQTPSEELAFQIISKTFDMKSKRVQSNIFNLPFIEVGMQINELTLTKCFNQLQNEYETLWYDEMKHLLVPKFHSRYDGITEAKRGPVTAKHQQKNAPPKEAKQKEVKSSSLSIFR